MSTINDYVAVDGDAVASNVKAQLAQVDQLLGNVIEMSGTAEVFGPIQQRCKYL